MKRAAYGRYQQTSCTSVGVVNCRYHQSTKVWARRNKVKVINSERLAQALDESDSGANEQQSTRVREQTC